MGMWDNLLDGDIKYTVDSYLMFEAFSQDSRVKPSNDGNDDEWHQSDETGKYKPDISFFENSKGELI